VWNLQRYEVVPYDIPGAGLRNSLKNEVGPMTPTSSRFDTAHDLFEKAAASDVAHPENQLPQQQQQRWQKRPTDCTSIGGTRGYRPTITEPDHTPGGESSQSGLNIHGKSGGRGQLSGLLLTP